MTLTQATLDMIDAEVAQSFHCRRKAGLARAMVAVGALGQAQKATSTDMIDACKAARIAVTAGEGAAEIAVVKGIGDWNKSYSHLAVAEFDRQLSQRLIQAEAA